MIQIVTDCSLRQDVTVSRLDCTVAHICSAQITISVQKKKQKQKTISVHKY